MKETIINLLDTELTGHISRDDILRLIEIPPSAEMGDFAFPCFSLARVLRKSPGTIAEELTTKFSSHPVFEKVSAMSGYLNFFINKNQMAASVLANAGIEGYGSKKQNARIVVEFASPNTNKPLHLGHLRNMSVGESVARIIQFAGNSVVRASINNDRGVHICKSMLAYRKMGNGTTPESTGKKSDRFVGDFYVLFSKNADADPSWNEDAQKMLRQWEAGDEEVRALWKTMNGWALDGFKQTYALFGIRFDKEYFESDIYTFGKEIIRDGLERGIFSKREDGAVVDLEAEKLGTKVLLRPDGTSVYIVQDLYLAVLKQNEFAYDRSVYVVGNEQEFHFNVLKAIFKKLGYAIADKIHHLSYGMVELPEGKMKSREGTVVDADDLITETAALAAEEIRARFQLTDNDVAERSLKIALAAIKYQLLRVDIAKNMLFDPKKAISFEGDTGPYLLYSYARAASIMRKANALQTDIPIPDGDFNGSEINLIKKLDFFPAAATGSLDKLSPSIIANYAFELAQAFNEFYHGCPVIGNDREGFRLQLVAAFRAVIKKCLWLLSIDEIEEM